MLSYISLKVYTNFGTLLKRGNHAYNCNIAMIIIFNIFHYCHLDYMQARSYFEFFNQVHENGYTRKESFDDFLNSFIVTSLFHNFFWESFDTLIDEITKTLEDSMDKELINAALSEYWQVEKRPLNQDILFSQKVHCPESLKDFDILT